MPDGEFLELMTKAEKNRYTGWRNWRGKWREVLGLDSTTGMSILDYGCGIGIESLQYARGGNIVNIADIVPANVRVAKRTLKLNGHRPAEEIVLKQKQPLIMPTKVDVVHCNGVLHHIREPVPVVKAWSQYALAKGGELRLMLYSDVAWSISTKTEPPENVEGHPKALQYARAWDGVGDFADWYDADRLEKRFGRWFKLERYEPLTVNGAYIGAIMRRK